jgi:hypothetical protein
MLDPANIRIVKRISDDGWNRPRLRNVVTGAIYANIDLVNNLDSNAWHTVSEDGEPDSPLKPSIRLVEFKDTKYAKAREAAQ